MSDYKVGDTIVMTDQSFYPITKPGAKGVILAQSVDSETQYRVKFDSTTCARMHTDDDYVYWMSSKYFRKDTPVYKRGDAIVMTEKASSKYTYTQKGAKGVIVSGPDHSGDYTTDFDVTTLHEHYMDSGTKSYDVHPDYFELDTVTFKNGDKVRIVKDKYGRGFMGEIAIVTESAIDDDGDIIVRYGDGSWGRIGIDCIEFVRDDSGAEIATLRAEIARLNERIAADERDLRARDEDLDAARRDLETMSAAYERLINAMTREQLIALVKNA